jgi:hypothetical protein
MIAVHLHNKVESDAPRKIDAELQIGLRPISIVAPGGLKQLPTIDVEPGE